MPIEEGEVFTDPNEVRDSIITADKLIVRSTEVENGSELFTSAEISSAATCPALTFSLPRYSPPGRPACQPLFLATRATWVRG